MRRFPLTSIRLQLCALAAALCAQLVSMPAAAGVTFYTDESEWRAAAGATAPVEEFDTTAAKVGLAAEASGPPGPNAVYPWGLTFPKDATRMCRSFAVRSQQYGVAIVFDDDGPTGSDPLFDSALSIGEIGSGPNDDFRIDFFSATASRRCTASIQTRRATRARTRTPRAGRPVAARRGDRPTARNRETQGEGDRASPGLTWSSSSAAQKLPERARVHDIERGLRCYVE